MKKVELLIPVGNQETLEKAIHNGADAVYLGGKKFGARAYANNFDNQELINAIKLCHFYNVKVYVTVNTMIYNNEVKEILEYLNFLYENNVDAVIMQDFGLINLTRKLIPNLKVHVSTQAHNQNEEQLTYYYQIGCQRVVFDRELSLEQIKKFKTPIEKEIFVYGALCICYSGNCLFSALNGTRSANRGMCVGSCRLPYKLIINNQIKKEGYLLSTKDLNTIEKLPTIISSNIDSLKIEGRMKIKEYVALITKTYRRLIDDYYNQKETSLTSKEKEDLLKTYNREFTKGYLFNAEDIINEKTPNHQGILIGTIVDVTNNKIGIKLTSPIHQEDAIRITKINKGMYLNTIYNKKGLLIKEGQSNETIYISNKYNLKKQDIIGSPVLKTIDYLLNKELNQLTEKKLPLTISFVAELNKNSTLIVKNDQYTYKITGAKATKAINSPTTKERISTQLSKLGNTPFEVEKISINIPSDIFINIKELNELRRQAINELIKLKSQSPNKKNKYQIPSLTEETTNNSKISILVRNEEQLLIALNNNLDYIYTPNRELYLKYKNHHELYFRLNRVAPQLEDFNNENLLCTELGSIIKYHHKNNIRSDYYLNVANDYTLNSLKELNVNSSTLSVECTISHFQNIKNKKQSEIIIYGTPECMIIKNNIFNLSQEQAYLEDIKHNKYLLKYEDNETHIYNHQPINLINNLPELRGFGTYRIELLNETPEKIQSIINKIKDML